MLRKLLVAFVLVLLSAGVVMAAEKHNPVVIMETSLGNVKMELFEKEAPLSVRNFLEYANSGFYNGTIFHRVISGFMIQGGGFTTEFHQKPTRAPIRNEPSSLPSSTDQGGTGPARIRSSVLARRSSNRLTMPTPAEKKRNRIAIEAEK